MKKITLLITSFNSLSQKIYSYLKDNNYIVNVVYAINDEQMTAEIKSFHPDIVFCSYLKRFIPATIFNTYDTFLIHPGIKGDKGAYSLEHVVLDSKQQWGVVILKVNKYLDAGDIYIEKKM